VQAAAAVKAEHARLTESESVRAEAAEAAEKAYRAAEKEYRADLYKLFYGEAAAVKESARLAELERVQVAAAVKSDRDCLAESKRVQAEAAVKAEERARLDESKRLQAAAAPSSQGLDARAQMVAATGAPHDGCLGGERDASQVCQALSPSLRAPAAECAPMRVARGPR
jgi:hypothetical protein